MTPVGGWGVPSALVDAVDVGMHEFKDHSSRQRGLFPFPLRGQRRKKRVAGCRVGVDSELGDDVNYVSECQR